MTVPVIASSTGFNAGASSTTLVMTNPASLAVGDLLLAYVAWSRSATGSKTLPSGWNVPANGDIAWNATSSTACYVAYKIADSSDVAATDFTFDASGGTAFDSEGIIQRITGAHATTPVDVAANQVTTSTTTGTFPSVTTTGADRLVELFAGQYLGAQAPTGSEWPNVAPSGTTDGTDSNFLPGGDDAYNGSHYFTQAAAGATGSKTVAIVNRAAGSRQFRALTVAIAPAFSDPPYIRPVTRADHLLRR